MYSWGVRRRISEQKIRKIKHLRRTGWSLPEIAASVKVGYGTAFRYVQGVEISPRYRKTWFGKRGGSIKRKRMAEERALLKAKSAIKSLTDKERSIFMAALYWGEGNKKEFVLTNSDPRLVKTFVTGLKRVFKLPKERLRVTIRIFEDMDEANCLKFWSQVINIPVADFVSVEVLKGKKSGKLAYGMCKIRVSKGGEMLKYIQALSKAVSESF